MGIVCYWKCMALHWIVHGAATGGLGLWLKLSSHYKSFKVISSLYCSHYTTCCLVFTLPDWHTLLDLSPAGILESSLQTTFCHENTCKHWHRTRRNTIRETFDIQYSGIKYRQWPSQQCFVSVSIIEVGLITLCGVPWRVWSISLFYKGKFSEGCRTHHEPLTVQNIGNWIFIH